MRSPEVERTPPCPSHDTTLPASIIIDLRYRRISQGHDIGVAVGIGPDWTTTTHAARLQSLKEPTSNRRAVPAALGTRPCGETPEVTWSLPWVRLRQSRPAACVAPTASASGGTSILLPTRQEGLASEPAGNGVAPCTKTPSLIYVEYALNC